MKEIDCYRLISSEEKDLSKYALDFALYHVNDPWLSSFGFRMLPLDLGKVFELCPTLARINEVFKMSSCNVLKMNERDYYSLHTDDERGCGINMLIQDYDSACVFVDENEKKLLKLEYAPNTLYLFNTQIPHQISNYSGLRLLLSIAFVDNKDRLSYTDVLEKLNIIGL